MSDILQIKFFKTYWIFWVMHSVISLYGISQRNKCFLAVPISSPNNMQQVVLDYRVPEAMNNLLLEIVFYKGKWHQLPYYLPITAGRIGFMPFSNAIVNENSHRWKLNNLPIPLSRLLTIKTPILPQMFIIDLFLLELYIYRC